MGTLSEILSTACVQKLDFVKSAELEGNAIVRINSKSKSKFISSFAVEELGIELW